MDLSINSVTTSDPYDISNDKMDEKNCDTSERTYLRSQSVKKERERIEKSYPKRIRKPLRSEPALNEEAHIDHNIGESPIAALPDAVDVQNTVKIHNVKASKEEGGNLEDLSVCSNTGEIITDNDVSSKPPDETKKMEGVDDNRSLREGKLVTAGVPAVAHMQASVLHALGLTRGIGMGVGFTNTLNLGKSMAVIASEPNKAGLATSATTTLAKTMPLLVNMKGSAGSGSGVVPSILPANLPPGRYVIISSTTAAATTPTSLLTTTTTHSTTPTSHTIPSSATAVSSTINVNPAVSPVGIPSAAVKTNRLPYIKSPVGSAVTSTPSNQRTHVGKTRGMRKSYTTSEKLAMIEAVESGLKKSVVADRFGVAPSTLACIILQKDKIRRDQSKTGLSRRRLRPGSSSQHMHFKQLHSEGKEELPSATDNGFEGAGGDGTLGASGVPFRSPGHAGGGAGGLESRSPLPFTHFLANIDQSIAFDQAQAEEIVSVPDLSDSLSYAQSEHAGSSPARYETSQEAVTSLHQSAPASLISPQRGAAVADQSTDGHVTGVDSDDDSQNETDRDTGYSAVIMTMGRKRHSSSRSSITKSEPTNQDTNCIEDSSLGNSSFKSCPNNTSGGGTKYRNPSHAAKNVTPLDRVNEFGDILMTDDTGQKLLCWACSFYLDHTRRSTIVEHLRSRKHGRCFVVAQATKIPPSSCDSSLLPFGESTDPSCSFKLEPQDMPHSQDQISGFPDASDVDSAEVEDAVDIVATLLGEGPILSTTETLITPRGGEDSSLHQLQDPKIEIDTSQYSSVDDSHVPAPLPSTANSTIPGSGGGLSGTSELSGLCLVKREVHCYSVLDQLMKDQTYTDVTITADGHTFYAHKIVLCVASSYFRRVLSDNSPGVRNVVVLRDISHTEMRNLLQFLYTGEATVEASDLPSFMRTAQMLEINSLSDGCLAPPFPPNSSSAPAPAPAAFASGTAAFGSAAQSHQSYVSAAPQALSVVNPQFAFSGQPTTVATPTLPFGLAVNAMRLQQSNMLLEKTRQALHLQQQLQHQSPVLTPSLPEHSSNLIVPSLTEMLQIPKIDKIYSEKTRRPGRRRKQPISEPKVDMLPQSSNAQKLQPGQPCGTQLQHKPIPEPRLVPQLIDHVVPEILPKALPRTLDPRPSKSALVVPPSFAETSGLHLEGDTANGSGGLELTSRDLTRPLSPLTSKSPKLCNGEQFKIKIRSVDSMTAIDFDVAESVSSESPITDFAIPLSCIPTVENISEGDDQNGSSVNVDCVPCVSKIGNDLMSPPREIESKGQDLLTDDTTASRILCQGDVSISEDVNYSNCTAINVKSLPESQSQELSSHSQGLSSLAERYQEDDVPNKRRKIADGNE